ncbi:uncharacterized protein LOC131876617 [Cryptomeria japonica]|uniref:uncharacterized protein LOC131876617 n=1 Tax=Cryptomeria japonica TaxID=3369 RepID=UPI0027DA2DC2|nr:uncharacterized protein LOC131876617 [Cryptomeria japonica]
MEVVVVVLEEEAEEMEGGGGDSERGGARGGDRGDGGGGGGLVLGVGGGGRVGAVLAVGAHPSKGFSDQSEIGISAAVVGTGVSAIAKDYAGYHRAEYRDRALGSGRGPY